MLVKYLGILERLEPRDRPSFHSDQDDQDPPEQNSFTLFTHLSSGFRKNIKAVARGQISTFWVCEVVLWRAEALHPAWCSRCCQRRLEHEQLLWECNGEQLPRYWGIMKGKTPYLDTRQGISYHHIWLLFYHSKMRVPPNMFSFYHI